MGTFIDGKPSGRHPQYQDTSSPNPTNNQNSLEEILDSYVNFATSPDNPNRPMRSKKQAIAAINKTIMKAEAKAFEYGIMEGRNRVIAELKAKSKGFKVEYQCYIIPMEQLENLGETHNPDEAVLAEKYKRWSVFAKIGNATQYVAVNDNDSSYSVTVEDGRITHSALLATNVRQQITKKYGRADNE